MLDSNLRKLTVHEQHRRILFDSNSDAYDPANEGPEVDIIRALNFGKDKCPECSLTVPKYAQQEHSVLSCSKSR